MGYYDQQWIPQQNGAIGNPTYGGVVSGLNPSEQNDYNSLIGANTPTTELGGTNNPTGYGQPGIEQWQDQRLGQLGAPTAAQQLPDWEKQQQAQYHQWGDQSQKMQQDQYDKAKAQFNGGQTAAQDALGTQQGAAQGALSSAAHSALGGAHGAAAAAGTATQAGAGMLGAQGNQMVQQKLADRYAGQEMMSGIANQQRGMQQAQWGQNAAESGDKAAYQQGWNATNDQAALWGDTMQSNRQIGDLGFQTGTAAANQQNSAFNSQLTNQYINSGINAVGQGAATLGSNNGGGGGNNGGGYGSSYDGTIYQQSPY